MDLFLRVSLDRHLFCIFVYCGHKRVFGKGNKHWLFDLGHQPDGFSCRVSISLVIDLMVALVELVDIWNCLAKPKGLEWFLGDSLCDGNNACSWGRGRSWVLIFALLAQDTGFHFYTERVSCLSRWCLLSPEHGLVDGRRVSNLSQDCWHAYFHFTPIVLMVWRTTAAINPLMHL